LIPHFAIQPVLSKHLHTQSDLYYCILWSRCLFQFPLTAHLSFTPFSNFTWSCQMVLQTTCWQFLATSAFFPATFLSSHSVWHQLNWSHPPLMQHTAD
jgi:hypothetical protein